MAEESSQNRKATSIMIALLLIFLLHIGPGNSHHQDLFDSVSTGEVDAIYNMLPEPSPMKGSDPSILWTYLASANTTLTYNTVELGDLNNDGNLDIASAYDGLGLRLWIQNENGSFQNISSPAITGNYNDIEIGDINNDGKLDIVAARLGSLSAWFGNGLGTNWSANVGPAGTGNFNAIDLCDINLDGDPDIVAALSGTGTRRGVQISLGNGAGTWTNGDPGNVMPLNVKYNGIFCGDFNNDGKPDIAAASDNGVDAWMGNGAGAWTLSDGGLPSSGTFSEIRMADLDNDGDLDIIAAGGNNNGIRVCKGNGAGTWTLTVTGMPTTGTYSSLAISDINLDGFLDIITSSTNSNQVVWTGDGLFNWYQQNNEIGRASCRERV